MTKSTQAAVLAELIRREPIFHRPDFGTSRADFEKMTDPQFWEVGASGAVYSRARVIDGVARRYENPAYHGFGSAPEDAWETSDFACRELGPDHYLLTYLLDEGDRLTRRATLWRRSGPDWTILYHQGTVVQRGPK